MAMSDPSKTKQEKKMINLTIPLYSYISSGSVFPWDSAFQTEDIATYERNGARLIYISMGSDTGTRLMAPALVEESGAHVLDIPLSHLANRSAVVIRVLKRAGEHISREDLQEAFRVGPSFCQGDAILLVTGWGDDQRWKVLGEDYVLKSPSFSSLAADFLAREMEKAGSDLLLTDCALLDSIGSEDGNHRAWLSLPRWMRLPYPSETAKAYLREYTRAKVDEDWQATHRLLRNSWVVTGLANGGLLTQGRVRLNVLPMFIEGVGEAPCTVVAEVEQQDVSTLTKGERRK